MIAKHKAGNSEHNDGIGDSDFENHESEPHPHTANDHDSDWEDEEDIGLSTLPPGEEGFYNSHHGGEVLISSLIDDMTSR